VPMRIFQFHMKQGELSVRKADSLSCPYGVVLCVLANQDQMDSGEKISDVTSWWKHWGLNSLTILWIRLRY
jgi:hypothetical protein